jgi:hypothetical protein
VKHREDGNENCDAPQRKCLKNKMCSECIDAILEVYSGKAHRIGIVGGVDKVPDLEIYD